LKKKFAPSKPNHQPTTPSGNLSQPPGPTWKPIPKQKWMYT